MSIGPDMSQFSTVSVGATCLGYMPLAIMRRAEARVNLNMVRSFL